MVVTPTPDLDPVLADLAERGYETTRLDGPGTPAAVATGGEAPNAVTDRPLSVEPLSAASPLSVVAPLAGAARDRRGTLFVAHPDTAETLVETLSAPFLRPAPDEPGDGDAAATRSFYAVPDRIRLTDGTLAAVGATGSLGWREGRPGGVATDAERDDPPLLLTAGDETVAALSSVDALTCPGPDPDAFPLRYARGDDGRFHVYDGDRDVGTFTSLTAMKSAGVRPVPLPLVPEHHVRENAHLARRWTVAVLGDDGVSYVTA